jgi:RNA polymerase sigma factor (sigma-70 family)
VRAFLFWNHLMPHSTPPSGSLEEHDFRDLIRRVRAGDAEAAACLVRNYEPEIRRVVRIRLGAGQMRRTLDSMDICQSVMANLFFRLAHGQFDLDEPADLLKLLVRMTRNKIIEKVRREHAERRGGGHGGAGNAEALNEVADDTATPSQVVANRDLVEEVRRRLSPEERRLADLRGQGLGWNEIAAAHGDSPERLRKKLDRAMDRVAQELGLENGPD